MAGNYQASFGDLNAIIQPDHKVLRMALADIQTDVTL